MKITDTFESSPSPPYSVSVSIESTRTGFNPRHFRIHRSDIDKNFYDFTPAHNAETQKNLNLEQLTSEVAAQLKLKFGWGSEYYAIDHRIDSIIGL